MKGWRRVQLRKGTGRLSELVTRVRGQLDQVQTQLTDLQKRVEEQQKSDG